MKKDLIPFYASDLLKNIPKVECHVHTSYSDGLDSVEDCVESAVAKGLDTIIFTEHVERKFHKTNNDWFDFFLNDIRKAQKKWDGFITIKSGLEIPVIDFDGNLYAIKKNTIEEVDFVLGTVHRYPGLGDRRVRDLDHEKMVELEIRSLLALTKNNNIDAIAHLGGTCAKYGRPLSIAEVKTVVKEAVRNKIAIEINSSHHKNLKQLLTICIEEKASITIGSDAHSKDRVGDCYKELSILKP